jgi:cytochrome c-type biogenesis protein CcmH/NrfG
MSLLYLLIVFLLTAALSITAIPFIQNRSLLSKNFLAVMIFMILFPLSLYFFCGDKAALKHWLTQGEQHYQLQTQVETLGGIDGIISRVKEKIKADPNDPKGWFILSKLYSMKHEDKLAKEALYKANKIEKARNKQ